MDWSSLGELGRGVIDALAGGPPVPPTGAPGARRPSHGGKEVVVDESIRRYREGVTPTPYPVELYDYDPVKPFETLPTRDEAGREQRRKQVDFAMPIALSAAGSGIPFAKPSPNTLGIFVGRDAMGVDLKALKRAEAFEKKGLDRDTIWKDTGWGRGVDGEWRTEISDHLMRAKQGTGSWADVIRHPDYFRARPEMLEKRATIGTDEPWGYYQAGNLVAHGKNPTQRANVTLHEMQHGEQGRSGFARGGASDSPDMREFAKQHREAANTTAERLMNELKAYQQVWAARKGTSDRDLKSHFREMQAAQKQWEKEFPDRAAALDRAIDDHFHLSDALATKRLAGEVEARNVQKRQFLTPEQRREQPPWKTQDTPDEDQIVRFFGKQAGEASEASRGYKWAPEEVQALRDHLAKGGKAGDFPGRDQESVFNAIRRYGIEYENRLPPGRPWTPEDVAALREHVAAGNPPYTFPGRTRSNIYRVMDREGIKRPEGTQPWHWTGAELKQLRDGILPAGRSDKAIKSQLRALADRIERTTKELGLPRKEVLERIIRGKLPLREE